VAGEGGCCRLLQAGSGQTAHVPEISLRVRAKLKPIYGCEERRDVRLEHLM
jgi:hypothetical protein